MRATAALGLFLFTGSQDPVADAQMHKRAQQLALCVAEHERLQPLAGSWDVELVASPGGLAESKGRGTVTGKTMLGGRYVVLNYQLQLRGQPFEAVQILGFDTLRQVYSASWRDDHSTWSVECNGIADAQAPERVLLRGTLADARDPAGRPFAMDLQLPGPDGRTVDVALRETHAGREVVMQTQRWTRR